MHRQRIKELKDFIKDNNLDAFIVSRMANIRYLCGFTGDAGLLIVKPNGAFFICDGRFHGQADREVKGARIIPVKTSVLAALKDLKQFHGKNVVYGYEPEYLYCADMDLIRANLPGALLIPVSGAVENLSIIKDQKEMASIEKAVEISDVAFERILGYIEPGRKEIEICAELEYQMKMLGSEKPAFDTIVASGIRSALPHGLASSKKVKKGEFVTIDFGATYKGYVSDITRTVVVGRATSKQKRVYDAVLRAQRAGIRKVRAGTEAKAVDSAARKVIDKAGFKKYFTHGTGHGIGIYVHVKPNAGPRSTDKLRKGMVLTVEPGIYIPNWGGVRIEDDVAVTSGAGRVLNQAPKKLLEL